MTKQQKLNQACKFMVLANAIFDEIFTEQDREDDDIDIMTSNLKTALDGAQSLRFISGGIK